MQIIDTLPRCGEEGCEEGDSSVLKLFCLGMPITGDVTRAEQKEGNRDNCPMAGGTGSGNQAEIGMERQRCNWQREHRK